MRIISWNVNGIRALEKKGFLEWLYNDSPDVLGLQETKASEKDLSDSIKEPNGYEGHFSSSKKKKGYSGVAVYSKAKPISVTGIGKEEFDDEGRVIISKFKDITFINCYFPNSGRELLRLQYKLSFNDELLLLLSRFRKAGQKIVLCGDFNVAHEAIDIARSKENEGHAGYHPDERAWLDELISAGFIDTFRHLYPEKKDVYSYWDTYTRARDRNVGWRIDYIFVSQDLTKNIKDAFILDHIMGSDHAPVGIELDI